MKRNPASLICFASICYFSKALFAAVNLGEVSRAIKDGDVVSLQRLLASGWDVNTPLQFGLAPLQYAMLENKLDIVHFLLDLPEISCRLRWNSTLLIEAVTNNDLEMVHIILSHTRATDLDEADANGNTAMHHACLSNPKSAEIFYALERAGANPNILNLEGLNALDYADEYFMRQLEELRSESS